MREPDFLEEVVARMESAYEPDEIVGLLELSMLDVARAFEAEFIDLAFNLGFIDAEQPFEEDYNDNSDQNNFY